MLGERGTAECAQCAHRRDFERKFADKGVRDETTLWEEDPCIDLKTQIGDVLISTVFLHKNHNYGPSLRPIFYETMIFQNVKDDCLGDEIYCNRYSSKNEAMTKHQIIVTFLTKQTPEEFVAWVKLIREESQR